jgi:hypothetical protein
MTDDERRAFEAGYLYGAENVCDAHDPLIVFVARVISAEELVHAGHPEALAVVKAEDERILAALAEVARLREHGAARMLELWEMENQ